MLKGIIFDLDGVLLNSAEYHRRAWLRLARELDVATTDEFFWKFFGQTNAVIIPALMQRDIPPEDLLRLSERKELLFREEARGSISLYDGVEELLSDLKTTRWRMALGTSTPRSNVDFIFSELGLNRYLETYTCSDDVKRGKPDPEVFLLAAGRLGLPPEQCVVIEDTFAGIEAAKAGGMSCIAVATTNSLEDLQTMSQADLVAGTTADLSADLLEKLL